MAIKTEVTLAPVEETTPQNTLSSETIQEIQQQVAETVTLQPIVQPIVYESESELPIQWQTYTLDPMIEEKITPAEKYVNETFAQPIIAKGVTVYNDTIPTGTVRPTTYVVFTVDDELRDISFSDNKNQQQDSFVTFIIQGRGNTFQNWVVEVADVLQDIARVERNKKKIHNITNRSIGFDEENNLLSRTFTFWVINKIDN